MSAELVALAVDWKVGADVGVAGVRCVPSCKVVVAAAAYCPWEH